MRMLEEKSRVKLGGFTLLRNSAAMCQRAKWQLDVFAEMSVRTSRS